MSQTSENIIITPVNIETDLGNVLGTGSGDVGTNVTAASVNPWTLYKPEAANITDMIYTEVDRKPNCYGLGHDTRQVGPPYATTIADLIAFYSDTNTLRGQPANGWRYNKPRGLSVTPNEWLRVSDFVKCLNGAMVTDSGQDGYRHASPNPFGHFYAVPDSVSRYYGHLAIGSQKPEIAEDEESSSYVFPEHDIRIDDIRKVVAGTNGKWYFGIILVPQPPISAATKLVGNTESIGETRGRERLFLDLQLEPQAYPAGTWMIYPCLSNLPFTGNVSGDNIQSGQRLYPIPGATPAEIEVTNKDVDLSINAIISASTTTGYAYDADWFLVVSNNTAAPVTLANGLVRLRLASKSFSDPIITGEVEVQIPGTITVPAASGGVPGTYRYPTDPRLRSTIHYNDPNLAKICAGFCKDGSSTYDFTGESPFITPVINEESNV